MVRRRNHARCTGIISYITQLAQSVVVADNQELLPHIVDTSCSISTANLALQEAIGCTEHLPK